MDYAVIEIRHLREIYSLLDFLERVLRDIGDDDKDENRLIILRRIVRPIIGNYQARCREARHIVL